MKPTIGDAPDFLTLSFAGLKHFVLNVSVD
jgi:hypothetical protein